MLHRTTPLLFLLYDLFFVDLLFFSAELLFYLELRLNASHFGGSTKLLILKLAWLTKLGETFVWVRLKAALV